MSETVSATTDASFEVDVINSELPVLVDFWAPWCNPCKMISPVIDELASEFSGRLNVYKVNVDENNEVPAKYGVRSIPTLLIFKSGNVVATEVGVSNKSKLVALLEQHIA